MAAQWNAPAANAASESGATVISHIAGYLLMGLLFTAALFIAQDESVEELGWLNVLIGFAIGTVLWPVWIVLCVFFGGDE